MAVSFTRQSPTWVNAPDPNNPPPEAIVLAEDAERWEQLGADTAAWSTLVDPALPSRSAFLRRGIPAACWTRSGLWTGTSGSWNQPNRLSLALIPAAEAGRVLNAVRYTVDTAGAAGSVLRFGFYDVNPATWRPTGTPVYEATGPGDATGQHQITLSPTVGFQPGRPLAFAAVCQGSTAPILPQQTSNAGAAGWYGTDSNAACNPAYTSNSTPPGLFFVDSVTGALPDLTAVTAASSASAPLVALRFA